MLTLPAFSHCATANGQYSMHSPIPHSGTAGCETIHLPHTVLDVYSPMKRKNWLVSGIVAIGITAGVALALLGSAPTTAPNSTFVLLDGTSQTTEDLRGKVTLVNFWATSCTSCVAEMPDLVTAYNKYHTQGFEMLAVAMQYDPPSYVVHFTESRKLPFKVAIDNTGAVARAWDDVKLTPTTFIVDKQGQVVKKYVGPPDFGQLHQLIEKLLAQS